MKVKKLYLILLFLLQFAIITNIKGQNFVPYNNWSQLQQITELADIDNDGDLDAFCTDVSFLYLFSFFTFTYYMQSIDRVDIAPNIGNASEPEFPSIDYNNSVFESILDNHFYNVSDNEYFFNGVLRFEDIDNDDDLDLFMSTSDELGKILYFKNIGNANIPNYIRDTSFDYETSNYIADFHFLDIDKNGDKDLIVNSFYYQTSCNNPFPPFCSVDYVRHNLGIMLNENGFESRIPITQLLPNSSCNCEYKDIIVQSFALREINNDFYLSYQVDVEEYNYDNDFESDSSKFYNAKLNIDLNTNEAILDETTRIILPFQSDSRLAVRDINGDGLQDLINGNLQLLSTNDPNIFNQTALNPYHIAPYVEDLPEEFDTLFQVPYFDIDTASITMFDVPTGISPVSEIYDLNNNGTRDLINFGFISSQSFGINIIDDFDNTITNPQTFIPFPPLNPIDYYEESNIFEYGSDYKFHDYNEDGLLDLFNYTLEYDDSLMTYFSRIKVYPLNIENDSLYFDTAITVFDQLLDNSIDYGSSSILADDFNADQVDDYLFIFSDFDSNEISFLLFINEGSNFEPSFSTSNTEIATYNLSTYGPFPLSANFYSIIDYDGDGDNDLTAYLIDDQNIKLVGFQNIGTIDDPTFGSGEVIHEFQGSDNSIALISSNDFNNDGIIDLMTHHTSGYSIIKLLLFPFFILPPENATLFENQWKKNVLMINNIESPFVLNNETINYEPDTITINETNLNLINQLDIDNMSDELVYFKISIPVKHGTLINTNTNEAGIIKFTQSDVKNGYVNYVGENFEETDAFSFSVYYGAFKLINQVFNINSNLPSAIDDEEILRLNIYPNPASQFIKLENLKSDNGDYVVTNINGQIVLQGALGNMIKLIDVKDLPKGIYNLEILSGKDKSVGSFVKL